MAFEGPDRFRVVGKLGEGGVGVVYEVEDRARDMKVALKTLRDVDPIGVMRFTQEFRTASDLAHLNIVGLGERWTPRRGDRIPGTGREIADRVAEDAEWERVTARYFLALAQRLVGDYHRAGRHRPPLAGRRRPPPLSVRGAWSTRRGC